MSIRNVRKLLRHADLLHLSVRLSIKSWVANFRNKKSAFLPLPPCPFRKLNVSHVWTTYRNLQKGGGRKSRRRVVRRVGPKALGHTHKLPLLLLHYILFHSPLKGPAAAASVANNLHLNLPTLVR